MAQTVATAALAALEATAVKQEIQIFDTARMIPTG